jgi:spore coat protein CotH
VGQIRLKTIPVQLMVCAAALVAGVALVGSSLQNTPPSPASTAAPRAATRSAAGELFDDTSLHDLWIRISAADLQQLRDRFQENTYFKAELEWRGRTVSDIGLRSRGGATRNGSKPGLQLDFDRYRAGQDFLGLKGLVLDNAWHDPSMIHERVSMQLFRRMGVPAPREAHARLYLGGAREYAGLYVMVEDIDKQFLERNFGEDDGYLFEYERVDGYHFGDLGDAPAEYAKRFEPQTHEDDAPAAVFGPLREMVRVINSSSPEMLPAAIAPYLDVDQFLTFLAVTNYLSVWDSFIGELGMANFSLYRFEGSTRSQFIPWDYDNAFAGLDFQPWWSVQENVLLRKLWAHAPTRERYLQTLLDVAASADGWLDKEVEREYQQVRAAVLADPKKYRTNAEFEQSILEMKHFADVRSARVRALVDKARTHRNPARLRNTD